MGIEELKARARAGGHRPLPSQYVGSASSEHVRSGRPNPPKQEQKQVPSHSVEMERLSFSNFSAPSRPRWWEMYSPIQGTQGYRSLGQTELLSPHPPQTPYPEGCPRVKLKEESAGIRRLFRTLDRSRSGSSLSKGMNPRKRKGMKTSASFSSFREISNATIQSPEMGEVNLSMTANRPQSAKDYSRCSTAEGRDWDREIKIHLSSSSIDSRSRKSIETVGIPESDLQNSATTTAISLTQKERPKSASAATQKAFSAASEQGNSSENQERGRGSFGQNGARAIRSFSRNSTESSILRNIHQSSRSSQSPLSRSRSPMIRGAGVSATGSTSVQSPLPGAMQWVQPPGRGPEAARRSSLPEGAFVGANSPYVTKAAEETRRAQRLHNMANESPPGALMSQIEQPVRRSRPSSRLPPPEPEFPASPKISESVPDATQAEEISRTESEAGKGIVRDSDERCKPGTKVRVASSFKNEDWARALNSRIGRISSPAGPGVWMVKFQGYAELVECCCGLMGRHHLVYVEEDLDHSANADPWAFSLNAHDS